MCGFVRMNLQLLLLLSQLLVRVYANLRVENICDPYTNKILSVTVFVTYLVGTLSVLFEKECEDVF